jgi:hypothetical protein
MAHANERVSANAVTIDGVAYRTNFALAKPGVCYLVYASRGGALEVALDKGDYVVTSINPQTGERRELGTSAGGRYAMTLPEGKDAVLIIVEKGASRARGRTAEIAGLTH